jgi:hypothetical protein
LPAGFDPSRFHEWFLLCGAGFSSCSWWFLSPCCSAAGVAVALVWSARRHHRRACLRSMGPSALPPGLLLFLFICIFILCRAMGWFWLRVACPPFKICFDFVFYGVAVQRRLEWLISGG